MKLQHVTILAAAAMVQAENTITFISQDVLDRTIYFTGNPNMPDIEPVWIEGFTNKTVDIPHGWVGNFFSVIDGDPIVPGMLGEFAFNAWGDLTFFDVSAIVNPYDWDGVKKIWPVDDPVPFSGCDIFPCNFAYYLPDDEQTKATHKTDFFCTLGNIDFVDEDEVQGNQKRDLVQDPTKHYPRGLVEGQVPPQ